MKMKKCGSKASKWKEDKQIICFVVGPTKSMGGSWRWNIAQSFTFQLFQDLLISCPYKSEYCMYGFISLHIQTLICLKDVVDDSVSAPPGQPILKKLSNLFYFHLTSSIKLKRCIRFCANRASNDVIIFITTWKVQKSLLFICSKFIIDNENYVIFVLSHDLIFCNRWPIFTS